MGSNGFISDGIDPDSGPINEPFFFRIIYSDAEDHPPDAGYPKIEIYLDGLGIPGNPFTMSEADINDTIFSDGKEYVFQKSFTNTGNYSHKFIAFDKYLKPAEGQPLDLSFLPVVYLTDNPELAWVNLEGYKTKGVFPDKAFYFYDFIYKVLYKDRNNDPPAKGYPKIHIFKDGLEIEGSPFPMREWNEKELNYTDGKIYYFSRKFKEPGIYSYSFESYDSNYYEAFGEPVNLKYGPEVVFPENTQIFAAPNPVKLNEHKNVHFLNIPRGSELKIYAIDGSIVFSTTVLKGYYIWNLRTNSNASVASGIYIYTITTKDKTVITRKLAIIK